MKMAVALCGAMWHYPKCQKMPKTGKTSFFDVFQESHENGCGAMWRYPKCQKCQKRGKHNFLMFSRNPMKMAVLLCGASGAIQNAKKLQKR